MKNNAKAFTLVELIVVITILSILGTIGFMLLSGFTDDAVKSKIRYNIEHLRIRENSTLSDLYNINMSVREQEILKKDNTLHKLLCKKLNTIVTNPDNKDYIIEKKIYKKLRVLLSEKELNCSEEINIYLEKFSRVNYIDNNNTNNMLKGYIKEAKTSNKEQYIKKCLNTINEKKEEFTENGKINIKGIQLTYLNCINSNIDYNIYTEDLIYNITNNRFEVYNKKD